MSPFTPDARRQSSTADVLYTSATFHPTAECEDCGAHPYAVQGPGVAKRWAKEHVARTGHEVLVTQVTRSAYYPARS